MVARDGDEKFRCGPLATLAQRTMSGTIADWAEEKGFCTFTIGLRTENEAGVSSADIESDSKQAYAIVMGLAQEFLPK